MENICTDVVVLYTFALNILDVSAFLLLPLLDPSRSSLLYSPLRFVVSLAPFSLVVPVVTF